MKTDIEKMLSAAARPTPQDERVAAQAALRLTTRALDEGLADIGYGEVDSPWARSPPRAPRMASCAWPSPRSPWTKCLSVWQRSSPRA